MKRGNHPNSLANLTLGRASKGKETHTITVSPNNWQWLKSRGKPSRMIDLIIEMNRTGELVGKFLLERAVRGAAARLPRTIEAGRITK